MWLSGLNSVTTARYNKASVADKKTIAASRATFTSWIERREKLLEMFYPDNEEIRREVVMAAVRDRTISLCALPKDDSAR